ncbi:MAG TPA: HAD family hydrolase [Candidatus Kapabacteria bacterium]|nr:HAD family hydrolase [Candidatus Kapabacteria bacterium]
MKFDAVIFDLDGTLLNSLEGIADAMNILLRQLGYPTHPVDAYKYFVGEGIAELVNLALPKEKLNLHPMELLVRDYRSIYDITWPQKSVPYEGVPEMLDALAARKIKLAVLSNKSDEFVRRMTSVLLPHWKFEVVKGLRPGEPRKPDPTPALQISASIGIEPAHTIFMGDSGVDMQTANRAQMYAVGVLWGFRPAEELLANGAQQLIKHPLELLDIVADVHSL